MTPPLTPAQEARVREIVREERGLRAGPYLVGDARPDVFLPAAEVCFVTDARQAAIGLRRFNVSRAMPFPTDEGEVDGAR